MAVGYGIDTYDGLSDRKKATNMVVNASFAGASIAAACLLTGPIGIAVGASILLVDLVAGDMIKDALNSLD